MEIEIERV